MDRLGGIFQHFFIDCPPGHRDITKAAMLAMAAELCVMPVAPSQKDVNKLRPTIGLAHEVGRPLVILLVKYRRWTLATRDSERGLINEAGRHYGRRLVTTRFLRWIWTVCRPVFVAMTKYGKN